MAQNKISLNLSAADFTLSHRFKGPSVLISGQDQNYYQAISGFSGDTPQRGINIPQIDYCENVVPTSEGYRSVAYKYFINEPETPENFVRIVTVFDGEANSALIGYTQDLKLFIVSAYTGGAWEPLALPGAAEWTEASRVTNTTIRGDSVICLEGVGVFKINILTSVLTVQALAGLDSTLIGGICSSSGYLIAWDATTFYWSSTEDPFDFVPSLLTGAGSAKPEGLKGKIVLCKEIEKGVILYADVVIISIAYTSSSALPWIFSVLQGGAGIRNMEAVAYDINMSNHFVWTSAGFLTVQLHQAQLLFPQLTDFIASGLEDKTTTFTSYPTTEFIDADKEVRLAVISARYVCISFGFLGDELPTYFRIPALTQTFIYDYALKRWGKLNIGHIQIFETPFTANPPVFF
jgi:hypothetical protein